MAAAKWPFRTKRDVSGTDTPLKMEAYRLHCRQYALNLAASTWTNLPPQQTSPSPVRPETLSQLQSRSARPDELPAKELLSIDSSTTPLPAEGQLLQDLPEMISLAAEQCQLHVPPAQVHNPWESGTLVSITQGMRFAIFRFGPTVPPSQPASHLSVKPCEGTLELQWRERDLPVQGLVLTSDMVSTAHSLWVLSTTACFMLIIGLFSALVYRQSGRKGCPVQSEILEI